MILSRNHKLIIGLFLGLAIGGFVDATYLAAEHYMAAVPPCFVTTGCDTVTTSQYSTIFGVSVALFGSLYYLLLIVLSVHIISSNKYSLFKYIAHLTWAGFLMSIYFTALQVFVIHAYCIYCLTSATISTALCIFAHYMWREHHKHTKKLAEHHA